MYLSIRNVEKNLKKKSTTSIFKGKIK